jgi:hypothetical protein
MDAKPTLLEQVRYRLRAKHYSYRTEQQYVAWIRRFILHHGKRHLQEMSGNANPTLTIVALAMRQAQYLRERMLSRDL